MPSEPLVQLRDLLVGLASTNLEFVVIGSSALAIHGWDVAPNDLDLLAPPDSVPGIQKTLGVEEAEWVSDGAAVRLECVTDRGPVDVYVEVSGPFSYADVADAAPRVQVEEDSGLSVKVGTVQHVRDMRAAAGRDDAVDDGLHDTAEEQSLRVIGIDGPAGAGKSTVTRALGHAINFTHLDTGAMYRCVALAVLGRRADPDDRVAIGLIAEELSIDFEGESVLLDGEDVTTEIRTRRITEATPHFAAYPEVRRAMIRKQRELFATGEGYVAEGRDITTVVVPNAPLKIYLTASLEERARRRSLESGHDAVDVREALRERDRMDSEREVSALKIADDAVVVDTTGRSVVDVVDEIVSLARARGLVK